MHPCMLHINVKNDPEAGHQQNTTTTCSGRIATCINNITPDINNNSDLVCVPCAYNSKLRMHKLFSHYYYYRILCNTVANLFFNDKCNINNINR